MLEIGKQYVFNTHGQDSEYKKYDNKVGTIIRSLKDGEEADISEVRSLKKWKYQKNYFEIGILSLFYREES